MSRRLTPRSAADSPSIFEVDKFLPKWLKRLSIKNPMQFPENLKYTKDHEWMKVEGQAATVGITAFAQDQLGDVVFVELPKIGAKLNKGQTFGVVESVKTVSDLFSPATGTVTAVNQVLEK